MFKVVFPSKLSLPMVKEFAKKSSTDPNKMDKYFIPEERLGEEEDIAGVALYYASRAGAYNNGNVSVLDGGTLGVMPGSY
jgi:NAD(P)-dependent dehydrogenase (short-subunit alcohol dehydrogenase family)